MRDIQRDEVVLTQARAESQGVQAVVSAACWVFADDVEQELLFPLGQGPWGAG